MDKQYTSPSLIAGLDPAIQAQTLPSLRGRLDARVKPAHEGGKPKLPIETLQRVFAEALLDPQRPVPFPPARFAVYRNNVTVGLVDALAKRFPVTQRIVGEEFFRAMARVYVRAHPPSSPLLVEYDNDFPGFIAAFEPASGLPYLPDVARLEAARTHAYHAADAAPLAASSLQLLDEATLAGLRLVPHPATAIIRSAYPIVTIWAMNTGERALAPIEHWQGEDALVTRPVFEVFVRALPPDGAEFLLALFAGRTLGEAAEAALGETEAFDLVANLAGMISSGAMMGC
jgi:hypothetical protein